MKQSLNRSLEIVLALSALLCAVSCTTINETTPQEEQKVTDVKISDWRQKMQDVTRTLYTIDPLCGYDNVEVEVASRLGVNYNYPEVKLRSISEEDAYTPSEGARKAISEMMKIDPSEYLTKDEYVNALMLVVSESPNLTDIEKEGLQVATYVSADLIELKYGNAGTELRAKWWDKTKAWCSKQWNDWGRCAAGVVGEAGLSALVGAAAGSEVPVVGTTVGAIVGGVSGGLVGAASFC